MDKTRTEEELLKDTFKLVDKLLNDNTSNIKKMLVSDEFLCVCYFIKYIETKDNLYYLKFSNLFMNLDEIKKIMVVNLVATYYKNNKKEKIKTKIKKERIDINE